MQLLGEVDFSFGNLSTLLEAHEVKRLDVSNLIRATEKGRVCGLYARRSSYFYRVEIFWPTRPRPHYLTTGETTRTMIVAAVRCRIAALYLQENRCCYCWPCLSRGRSVVTWNQPRNYSSLSMPGFFIWAYCDGDNLWCVGKGKFSNKECKIFDKNSLHDCKSQSPNLEPVS